MRRRALWLFSTLCQTVDDHQNTTPDPRMHYLASVDTYIYGYETARERETRMRPETVAAATSGGGKGGEKQTTGAEECETEYDQLRQGS